MKPPVLDEDFEFLASPGYLHINCKRCGGNAEIEYQGLDPVMPKIGTRCEHCGTSTTFKIFNPGALKGFHPEPYRREQNE